MDVRDATVRFSGEQSTLSNLVRCNVRVRCSSNPRGYIDFASSEHAYHWAKLQWMGEREAADNLHNYASPMAMMRSVKLVTGRIKNSYRGTDLVTGWRDVYAEQLLLDLVLLKTQQHPWFETALRDNRQKTFIEATPDSFWGCGIHRSSVVNLSDNELLARMTGQNRFGKILGTAAELLDLPKPAQVDFDFFVRQGAVNRQTKVDQVNSQKLSWDQYKHQLGY